MMGKDEMAGAPLRETMYQPKAPPMQGDEIAKKITFDWTGTEADLQRLITEALFAAEARGYERGKREGLQTATLEYDEAVDRFYAEGIKRGFLRCREEAAKVVDKLRHGQINEKDPYDVAWDMALQDAIDAIRSLKPEGMG